MRIAITLEYQGTNYLGWQKNAQDRTVCYVLEQTFAKILGEEVKIVASGRTDAGVHAMAQVAHLDLPKTCKLSSKSLVAEVNKNLPKDLRIVSAKEVSERFHARYNVKSKTYLYKCYTSPTLSPLREDYFCHYPAVLNLEKIKNCAKILIGKHNFKAFCLTGGDNESFEREILSIDVIRKKDEVYFYVKGKGFLYSMVRIIVGVLLKVGQNKITEEVIRNSLKEDSNISFAREKMPACGLYLYEVEY